jgi:hypothetical protein
MRPSSSLSLRENNSMIRNPNQKLIRKPLSSGYYSDCLYGNMSPDLRTEYYEPQANVYRGLSESYVPVMDDPFFSNKYDNRKFVMNSSYCNAKYEGASNDDNHCYS